MTSGSERHQWQSREPHAIIDMHFESRVPAYQVSCIYVARVGSGKGVQWASTFHSVTTSVVIEIRRAPPQCRHERYCMRARFNSALAARQQSAS